ncbi:MAG: dephospho-CoA kinase [Rhodobacteraceae bacterium]|nr:dephospho-CoA kinase [Paracoccaceae bacterium]
MIIVGLTGSIAMGKSETAKMFRALKVPVFDADQAVHLLYSKGGRAVENVGALFPSAIIDGAVNRTRLAEQVLNDKQALKDLERIVHPLVQEQRQHFIDSSRREGQPLIVLDIPLLFETNSQDDVDKIVVVSAPSDIQRDRALQRPGMTEEKFESILRRQVPDEDKRAGADFVVDSSKGLAAAQAEVVDIVQTLLNLA